MSPFVIVGLILGSHVFVVTCTLGSDDGTFLAPKVKGMACDCYAKCREVPPSLGAPMLPIFVPHP
jgi:hypothetical protein